MAVHGALVSAGVIAGLLAPSPTSEKQRVPFPPEWLESAEAGIDEFTRSVPTTRPIVPQPNVPPQSTPENVDTGRSFLNWQRATDDWNGLRPTLEDRGIAFDADLTIDHFHNLRGGIDTSGSATTHLFNLSLTLDTERVLGHPGGTFFANHQQLNGQSPSDEAGDVQAVSNIDIGGTSRSQLSEIWYEQRFLDDALQIKLGKIDANAEFAYSDHAAEFINSGVSFSPTTPMPTYPDPAFGAVVYVHPTEAIAIGLGVFDGSLQEGIETGQRGPGSLFGGPGDLFYIAELSTTWSTSNDALAGRVAVGAWHHDGTFERFTGGTRRGAWGGYAVVDQQLWREHPDTADDAQGIAGFVLVGLADADVSEVRAHLSLGATWTGAIDGRNDDVIGLATSTAWLSRDAGYDAHELAMEAFYKLQFTSFLSLKADLQYILNPGGGDDTPAAVTVGVRMQIDF